MFRINRKFFTLYFAQPHLSSARFPLQLIEPDSSFPFFLVPIMCPQSQLCWGVGVVKSRIFCRFRATLEQDCTCERSRGGQTYIHFGWKRAKSKSQSLIQAEQLHNTVSVKIVFSLLSHARCVISTEWIPESVFVIGRCLQLCMN